ncbi:uncharacterized protein M6B38_273260 [Iris pallida]|uniref:GRF-type domain-containing protein n=1 Tax=Iris pallida TaxID=29817 RepID=A0AAX6I5U3_IRIPA|nr:uncharacterized protein M6B38_273260 [Iris pallida]
MEKVLLAPEWLADHWINQFWLSSDGIGIDTMQRNLEASAGYLRTKAFQYNFQQTGNNEGFSEHRDEMPSHPGNVVESENFFNREASAPPNPGYHRPLYQQDFRMWPNVYPDVQQLQHGLWNTYGNHYQPMNREYPFPVENGTPYLPLKMSHHSYTQEFHLQDFQYFVVIDFEATCDKERSPYPQEIIEFPSVLVNSVTGELEACFQTYVRPSYHQHLTDFCKELTGIEQIQVDTGVPLSEALLMHDEWLESKGIKQKSFAVVTWSNWDCRVMLESECRLKRIRKPPYFNKWINLKVPFQEVFGGVRCNLKNAVQLAGLAWEGRAHCGLDDARNTARLLAVLMRRGFRFAFTNSLMWQPTPDSRQTDQATPPPLSPSQRPQKEAGQCQTHSLVDSIRREHYCKCGARSSPAVVRKPGAMYGRWYFGCGKWTVARRAECDYFHWA